jgi:hypothetical protein
MTIPLNLETRLGGYIFMTIYVFHNRSLFIRTKNRNFNPPIKPGCNVQRLIATAVPVMAKERTNYSVAYLKRGKL